MKKSIIITLTNLLISTSVFAQAPESISYQAIVRDNLGHPLPNTSVTFQFNILQTSVSGTTVYSEEQTTTTNGFGLVNLNIGQGTVQSGTFSAIDWSSDAYFLNIQMDLGSGFVDMGTQQFISVPYALYAKSAGSGGTTYTAGNGISITGNVIENTASDQTVTITDGGATTVTGTYPNFNISSTDNVDDADADATNELQTLSQSGTDVTLSDGGGTISVADNDNNSTNEIQTLSQTGTNVTLSNGGGTVSVADNDNDASNELQTLAVAGNQLSITGGNTVTMNVAAAGNTGDVQFNNSGSLDADPDLHWDITNKKFIVGQSTDDGRMIIQQDANAPDTIPILEVKNKSGQTIFVVYPDSVHIYINDDNSKGVLKGGFAVSGRSGTKAVTNDFLLVRPDSTRIWTRDTIAGFGIRDLSTGSATSYMHLTPLNYFIGHQSGDNTHLDSLNPGMGMHNTFFGYQAGQYNTTGYQNTFIGYQAGQYHLTGAWNLFLGQQAGYNNTDGLSNIFIGKEAGYNNPSGTNNMCIGNQAGYSVNSTSFFDNVLIGNNAGHDMTSGYDNTFLGVGAGGNVTFSDGNTYLGSYAGDFNPNSYNTFVGSHCGIYATEGNKNVFMGYETGNRSYGSGNVFIGYKADYNSFNYYDNSIMIGDSVLCTASNQVRLGNSNITSLYCQGAYAATTATAANLVVLSTGQIRRSTSSKRYKKDISDIEINTSKIYDLKPVSYTSITDNKRHFGLIAEDVALQIPELAEYAREKDVIPGSNSDKLIPDAVQYPLLSVLLLNEVKKHDERIKIQNDDIKNLKDQNTQLKIEINDLKSKLKEIKDQLGTYTSK